MRRQIIILFLFLSASPLWASQPGAPLSEDDCAYLLCNVAKKGPQVVDKTTLQRFRTAVANHRDKAEILDLLEKWETVSSEFVVADLLEGEGVKELLAAVIVPEPIPVSRAAILHHQRQLEEFHSTRNHRRLLAASSALGLFLGIGLYGDDPSLLTRLSLAVGVAAGIGLAEYLGVELATRPAPPVPQPAPDAQAKPKSPFWAAVWDRVERASNGYSEVFLRKGRFQVRSWNPEANSSQTMKVIFLSILIKDENGKPSLLTLLSAPVLRQSPPPPPTTPPIRVVKGPRRAKKENGTRVVFEIPNVPLPQPDLIFSDDELETVFQERSTSRRGPHHGRMFRKLSVDGQEHAARVLAHLQAGVDLRELAPFLTPVGADRSLVSLDVENLRFFLGFAENEFHIVQSVEVDGDSRDAGEKKSLHEWAEFRATKP